MPVRALPLLIIRAAPVGSCLASQLPSIEAVKGVVLRKLGAVERHWSANCRHRTALARVHQLEMPEAARVICGGG